LGEHSVTKNQRTKLLFIKATEASCHWGT